SLVGGCIGLHSLNQTLNAVLLFNKVTGTFNIRLRPARNLLPQKLVRNVQHLSELPERVGSLCQRTALHVAPMNLSRGIEPPFFVARNPRGKTKKGFVALPEGSLPLNDLSVQRSLSSRQRLRRKVRHLPKKMMRRRLCHSRQIPNVAILRIDKWRERRRGKRPKLRVRVLRNEQIFNLELHPQVTRLIVIVRPRHSRHGPHNPRR